MRRSSHIGGSPQPSADIQREVAVRPWIGSHLTFANVVSLAALFVALGGTATAVTYVVSSNSQIGPGTVSGHKAPSGKHPNIIAGSINGRDLNGGAVSGGKLAPNSVDGSKVLDDSLTGSDIATDSLTGADVDESSLGTVANSMRLGNRSASGYQRRVIGACGGVTGIQSVDADGGVSCTQQSVFPIAADLTSNNAPRSFGFGSSKLVLLAECGSSAAGARFTNNGNGGATLNWLFSQGGATSTVNASGTSLGAGGGNLDFVFASRIEGQWIFADAGGVTTVNLHGFYLPGSPAFCEFKGTAEFAFNS
jgi:hypothetical protein